MRVALWDVDPSDALRPDPDDLVIRVLRSVRRGSVVLLHDGGADRSLTLAALPELLASLTTQGYALVTLDELARRAGMRTG